MGTFFPYFRCQLGSTIVTIDEHAVVRSRTLHTPYGETFAADGRILHHLFAGDHGDPPGLYALGQPL